MADVETLRGLIARVEAGLNQARGALHLDAMVDEDGAFFGTTTVALEAIADAEAALALLTQAEAGHGTR